MDTNTTLNLLYQASGQAHHAIDLMQKLGQAIATGTDHEVTGNPAGLDSVLTDVGLRLNAAIETIRDAQYELGRS